MAANPPATAVVPPLLTVRVFQAASTIPVKGLFIAFRLKRVAAKEGETKAEKVAHVVETLRVTELAKQKKQNQEARYKLIEAHYEQQRKETVPDPADEFVLGITDIDGYLEPVYEESNPWRDRAARLEPDSFKFAVGEQFDALYIRHPSAAFARAVTRALNKGEAGHPAVDFGEKEVFGEGKPSRQTFTVEKGSGEEGEQYVIHLPSTPEAYVPLWPVKDSSGKLTYRWWLYFQMPHENLPTVQQQLEQSIDLLGRLKFPATGSQDFPYFVDELKAEMVRKKDNANYCKLLDDAIHTFHTSFQASLARFQENVEAGEAFQPTNWDEAKKRHTWASQVGKDVEVKEVIANIPALETWGILGPATFAQIQHWHAQKWLKRRDHLVTIGIAPGPPGAKVPDYQVYMLGRAAFAINAWSGLADCFGSLYGISTGHTFRNLCAEGGRGAIKNSIHKSGLAIDLTGGGLRKTKDYFPVRFEAEFRRVKQDVTEKGLQQELAKQQAALDATTKSCQAEHDKAEEEVRKAEEAKAALLAKYDLNSKASKQQIATNNLEVSRAEKAIQNAKLKVKNVDAGNSKKTSSAKANRDAAKANLDDFVDKVSRDAYRVRSRWSMRFRLYSQSKANVFAKDEKTRKDALQNIRTKIAKWAGIPLDGQAASQWPSVNFYEPPQPFFATLASPQEQIDAKENFFVTLREKYLQNVDRKEADAWLATQFTEVYAFAKSLLALSDEELVNRYFRPTVTQWKANFYEFDGGSDYAKPHEPNDFDDDFPAGSNDVAVKAYSWLNLTRLGYHCQMHRISPHRDEIREQTSDQKYFAGKNKKPILIPPPRGFPMMEFLKWEGRDLQHKAEDIVIAIEDITATGKDTVEPDRKAKAPSTFAYNPESYEIEFHKRTGSGNATECEAKILAKYVDAAFLKAWRPTLDGFSEPVYNGKANNRVYKPEGAQFSVALNALNEKRTAAIDKACEVLAGARFAGKRFMVVEAGQLLVPKPKAGSADSSTAATHAQGSYLTAGTVFTGAQLADAIGEAKKRLIEFAAKIAAPKNPVKAASEKASKEKPAKQQKEAGEEEVKLTVADWSFLVQPIFTLDDPPGKPGSAPSGIPAGALSPPTSAPSTPKLLFLPHQIVMLPARKDSGGLEWWHYQHNSVGLVKGWRNLLAECGYSDKILRVPVDGTLDPAAEPVHVGGGYSEGGVYSELDGQPWSETDITTEPPNLDTDDDEKLEEAPEEKPSPVTVS